LSAVRIVKLLINISITTTAKSVLSSNAKYVTTPSRFTNDSGKTRIRPIIIALTAATLFTGGNRRKRSLPTNAVIGNAPVGKKISKSLTTLKK
jgi:hypothetical protein